MGERVVVVGTGLIGGSIGLALRRATDAELIAVDADPRSARRAVEVGAAHEAADLETACAGAALVVVATPVAAIVPTVGAVARVAAPHAVVTDVGSTKGPVVAEAERLLPGFVGGHPMAGSELEGVDAARADLFEGALWILTPTPHTDAGAYRRVNALVGAAGARALALDAEAHDRLVALVSHLPYAIATTLMELAGSHGDERVFRAAAGSFRDMTRTAGSNPRIWRDILAANRDALLQELDAFSGRLTAFRDALAASDWDALDGFVARARETRARLPLKGERGVAAPWLLEVPVLDRAGVLAEITTAMGALGINIEDLSMEHSATGGVVHLVVDGGQAADRAAAHLRALGYRPASAPLA